MKPTKKKPEKLASELENRKRNLAVIQETMRSDPSSEPTLEPVKNFLSQRIESIEIELRKS